MLDALRAGIKRILVLDDSSALDARMRFYTVEKLGAAQELTPEGFLLCKSVRVARTGDQMYGPDETPVDTGPKGYVIISREADEVFRPEFIASFSGKAAVNDHPNRQIHPNGVTPLNWRDLAIGTVQNPRRGDGADSDYVVVDMLITDAEGIAAVRSGKREVSVGYEADYEQLAPGHGRQLNMIANHIALVDAGRCGPSCAIHDGITKSIPTGDTKMSTKSKGRLNAITERIRKAFATKDEAGLEQALTEAEDAAEASGDPLHLHIDSSGAAMGEGRMMKDEDIAGGFAEMREAHKAMQDTLSAIAKHVGYETPSTTSDEDPEEAAKAKAEEAKAEDAMAEEVPEGKEKEAAQAQDSAFFADSFQDAVAMAEILVPGIRVPAYDAAAPKRKTYDALCDFRRKALDTAYLLPENRSMFDALLSGKALDTRSMSCSAGRTLFKAVAAMKKEANNRTVAMDAGKARKAGEPSKLGPMGVMGSPAALNRYAKDFWSHQSKH